MRISIPAYETRWIPDQRSVRMASISGLKAGDLVVIDHLPYEIVSVTNRNPNDWSQATKDQWVEAGMPDVDTWYSRPAMIRVRPKGATPEQDMHFTMKMSRMLYQLPEHYAICHCCGEIPPCRYVYNNHVAERQLEVLESQMQLHAGLCHACGEPVTTRQKSILFAGMNLIRPDLGNDTAVFHLRNKCHFDAVKYERKWIKAEAGRRRRLECPGRLNVHLDETSECSEGPDCPSPKVDHKSIIHHRPYTHMKTYQYRGCWCVAGIEFEDPRSN